MLLRLAPGFRWGAGGFLGVGAATAATLFLHPPGGQTPAPNEGRAPANVTLSGVSVSGKSPEEIRAVARELAARVLATPLGLHCGRAGLRTTPAKLGAAAD